MKNKKKLTGWGVMMFLILLAADQITKYLAAACLSGGRGISLIPGVFELFYLENRGAAFGVLKDQQWFFIGVAVIMLLMAWLVYCRLPGDSHFNLLRVVCVLIASGAAGNMLDRLFRHYVVDFLYFSLINFPVFNVADCYVTVGAVLMAFLFLFYYKDEESAFLNVRKEYDRKEEI